MNSIINHRGIFNHRGHGVTRSNNIYFITSSVKLCVTLWLLIIFVFLGCYNERSRKIVDRAGIEVQITYPIERIISMAPSNTEIIIDLGLKEKLIAVDQHSKDLVEKYLTDKNLFDKNFVLLDFFFPDAEVIIQLQPDLIIASGHNSTGSGIDPFVMLRQMGIPVVYIPMSRSINDIYDDITFIAEILQVQENGKVLIEKMKMQIETITERTKDIQNQKTIYFEISPAPEMMTFGKNSFISDKITAINAKNIFENENWLVVPSAEIIISRNPDVILTNVNYIDDPIAEIKSRPAFNQINAVKNNRVYYIDNNSSVRASARIIFALEQMSMLVYPEQYD